MRYTYRDNSGKRWISLLLIFLLTFSVAASFLLPVSAVTREEIDAMKREQTKLQSKIGDLQDQIDALQSEKNSALEQTLLYQQQADALAEQVANTSALIEQYQQQIEQTQTELTAAEEEEAEYYELYRTRIRSMEENGTLTYWQILLTSRSFSELLDNINLIAEIVSYDNSVRAELEALRKEIEETKTRLETEKTELEQALKDLEAQKAKADAAYQAADAALQVIRNNEAVYAEKIGELEQQNRELEEDIVSSEAEYAAQLEELQQTSNPTQPQQPTQPSSPPSTNTSALGAQIASYACQFIGNPYVWGGTSLTNGCDCSGFVMSVYKHFGYTLPRTSYSQETCGRAVSYANAQPGDIVCYTGHVGIYIGDGMMVNALNSRTGIVISSVNIIRSGFHIRRVI